jgi:pentatricopeptide repeat protein
MTQTEKDLTIYEIEEFYCNRMEYLVNLEEFDDAHSIFEEFIVDGEEPEKYVFIPYHEHI